MAEILESTPAAAGFAMPAEWDEHAACLMSWPTRRELWEGRLDEAKRDYAKVARAIADHEPLTMVCLPGAEQEVRNLCGSAVEVVAAPLDDSWMRDNGPTFVRNAAGEIAVVSFEFNAWGERWHPYDSDNAIPLRVAEHFGVPAFEVSLVLEGGSFFVDGAGTLLTTEQCLLNPNRNPSHSRNDIERMLKDSLGVTTVLWLPFGHSKDVGPAGTDGHVDGVAQYVSSGRIVLEVPTTPEASEFTTGNRNVDSLRLAADATGVPLDIVTFDPGVVDEISYLNFYLANGAVIVPIIGDDRDEEPLTQIAKLFPEREIVGVPGDVLAFGGGGPHCITQQVPVGAPAKA
jgi:agmatine deiminase